MERVNQPRPKFRQRGMTLIELMVVVVIVTILAAVGYPSYTEYVTRSKRQAGKNMLYRISDRQEQFFLDNRAYAASLANLGYAAATMGVKDDGQLTTSTDADRIYVIDLTNTSATTYTVRAVPQLVHATRDSDCATLTLTHTNVRDKTGSGTNCW